MFIGGGAGGVGGGIRTTAIVLLVRCIVGGHSWRSAPGGEAVRWKLVKAILVFVLLWIAVNAASAGLLGLLTDGTWYEVVLESTAACNSVGLSTGLSLHLTWAGRAGMILILIAGRVVPVAYWLAVSRRFTQGLVATNQTRSSHS
jgi:trk system potassium uptake protein TrkH